MASFNRVILMGNLTRDPEVRQTQSGLTVVKAGLAVNDRVPDGQGGWTEKASFFDITLFGKRGEAFGRYLTKGRPVLIEGRLEQDRWQDKESGQNRSKVEIIVDNWEFVGGREEGGGGNSGGGRRGRLPAAGVGGLAVERFAFRLTDGPLDGDWAREQVRGDDAGCVLVFHGTVRGEAHGKAVLRLEYEAYEDMAGAEVRRIVEEVLAGHAVLRAAVEHSTGTVRPGERSLAVALAAAHRSEVFAAAAALMDELKARAPLWKREVYADGSEWKGQGS